MFRKTPLVLLVGLVVATAGRADVFVTGTETINEPVFGGSQVLPNTQRIAGTALGGYEFANDITSTSPTANDLVNIIVVDKITGYITKGGVSPNQGFGTTTVTMVAAIQARITSTTGGAINTTFVTGQLGLFSTPGATYNILHPATWGATTAGVFNSPLALYSLRTPPTDVIGGPNGIPENFFAAQINSATVNTGAGQQSQARVLFDQVRDGGFAVIDPVTGQTGVGQFAQTAESIQGSFSTLSAADQTALNAIMNGLDPGKIDSAFGFADFAAVGATNYTPSGTAATGDAEFTFGINLDPGNFLTTTVPEPATLSLWGLLLGSGGVGGLIRRYRSRRAGKA